MCLLFFKAGSIFIIDRTIALEDDNLIAIKLAPSHNIQIKKYRINKNKIVLKSLVSIFGLVISPGALSFPLSFILSDTITEVYGYKNARLIII